MESAELVVIGGGVVGLAAAWVFARRHPTARVVVLEKEPTVGAHASGRNSGVLHAGFYYSADSLKARFSAEGCAGWKAFCRERGLPLLEAGKLVVARSEADHAGLEELARRGAANGVPLERVSEAEAAEIEPHARTVGWALFSPNTATVDPGAVMAALAEACRTAGVEIRTGCAFQGRAPDGALRTDGGPLSAGRVLNAAGVHADRVAAAWGCGEAYQLVPFRGAYLLGNAEAPPLRACVYPVPDLGMPFLGVHFTTVPSGTVKIGPTALPARWREDYGGVASLSGAPFVQVLGEALGQAATQASLVARNASVRRLALEELRKLSRGYLVAQAARLARGVAVGQFPAWGRPGIRAQLVDRATGTLVLDFVVEAAERSVHVLNAVSPAFTCALPFAELLCDRLQALGEAA